jgi:hypothetical protein
MKLDGSLTATTTVHQASGANKIKLDGLLTTTTAAVCSLSVDFCCLEIIWVIVVIKLDDLLI